MPTEQQQFLNAAEVLERYGFRSQMWLRRMLQTDDDFPRPLKLGPKGRFRLWSIKELIKYEKQQAASR
jgi:predicted DNA-binding transcriptional regulator AlpA